MAVSVVEVVFRDQRGQLKSPNTDTTKRSPEVSHILLCIRVQTPTKRYMYPTDLITWLGAKLFRIIYRTYLLTGLRSLL